MGESDSQPMSRGATPIHPCPTCGRAVERRDPLSPAYPFCSPRCQWIDLGKWLREAYGVPAPGAQAPDEPVEPPEG